jgi:hypothetical protein
MEAVPIADPARRRERRIVAAAEPRSALRPIGARVERRTLTDVGDGHLVALG